MPASSETSVVQQLRRTLLRHDLAEAPDGQPLESFVDARDEAAFEALLRRHGPMVLGVCRRLLHNVQDAEDAFQATFLVLCRKAASISPRHLVGNWLYGVAYQTAIRARSCNNRRLHREKSMASVPERDTLPSAGWHDLAPLLDRELARLPDKYRVAVVLCDLEGKTQKAAASLVGVPEGTLSSRLARGRALLAKHLSQRGLSLSTGALTAALVSSTDSAALPPTLIAATVKAAHLLTTGKAATGLVTSAAVATLMDGVLKTMLVTKLKLATAVLLGVGSLGAGLLCYGTQASEPPTTSPAAAKEMVAGKVEGATAQTDEDRFQGTWELVSVEENGADIRKAGEQRYAVMAGDKWTTRIGERKQGLQVFTLNAIRTPRAIDLLTTDGEIVSVGIYQLQNDTLTLCWCIGRTLRRPTEFTTGQGSATILYVYRRVEEGKHKPASQAAPAVELTALQKPEGKALPPDVFERNSRDIELPFRVEPAIEARLKEVRLFASADAGLTWQMVATSTPDNKHLRYVAPEDGLYWFAVQTVDKDGTASPHADLWNRLQPAVKVLVRTKAP